MEIAVTHRLDDTNIEKAWKHAETEEIENLAAELLRKAQEAQSIEDDLFCILYLAFRCGFKTAIGNIRVSKTIDTVCSRRSEPYGDNLDNLSAFRAK
jgi:hypothetical protein